MAACMSFVLPHMVACRSKLRSVVDNEDDDSPVEEDWKNVQSIVSQVCDKGLPVPCLQLQLRHSIMQTNWLAA